MSRPIDSILIPTDGSDGAISGAKCGLKLASTADADVHVLSVVDASDEAELGFDGESPLEGEAERAVEDVAAMGREVDADVEITTAVRRGTPSRVIPSYADRHEIDGITMGTKGRTGIDRFLLGSVTENVLRLAETPVLAVPPGADESSPDQYERVLLPTDGSAGAKAAVDWGIALAELFDATLHTVYSVDTSRLPASQEPDEILSALERTGQQALDTVRERARDAEVSATGSLASGPPAEVILTYADEQGIDLIVMGTQGRSGLSQRFLGSVTENVVRDGNVPVFCVPLGGELGRSG